MAWPGWMQFAGAEIVNVERTAQYVEKNLAGLRFENTYDSELLARALAYVEGGDPDGVYESPLVDRPDWFDPNNPDTYGFYGFYPLTVEGMEDSRRTTTVTELSGDGAVASQPRHSSRQVRITGLLLGNDSAAVSAGMVWLRKALEGTACGGGDVGCSGDTLCYFVQPPQPCCEGDEAGICGDEFVLTEDGHCVPPAWYDPTVPCPTGYMRDSDGACVPDPDADYVVPWPVGPAGVTDCITGMMRQMHDVTLLEGPRVVEEFAPTVGAMRRVEFILVAADPHIWGLPRDVTTPVDLEPVIVGGSLSTPWLLDVDRVNLTANPSISNTATTWSGTPEVSVARVGEPGPTGEWGFLRAQFQNVGETVHAYVINTHMPVTAGTTYTLSMYVRSQTVDTVRLRPWWYLNGANLTSAASDPFVLHPGWNRVHFTATAPATANQLRVSLYMPSGTTPLTRVNLANNPASEVRAWDAADWGSGGAGVVSRVTTGEAWTGSAFTRLTWTTGADSGGGVGGVGSDNVNIPIAALTPFSASVMVRTSRATNLQLRMGGAYGMPVAVPANVWTRLTVDGVQGETAGTLSPIVRPSAHAGEAPWRPGDYLDVDGLLVETGASADPLAGYFDGHSLGGEWSGEVGASRSTKAPVVDLDSVMVEEGDELLPYFDGATPSTVFYRYGWQGTANESPSFRRPVAQPEVDCTEPIIPPVRDPELPVLPTPPRPPAITNPAVTPSDAWLRRVQEIPSGFVPMWSDATPIVTIDNQFSTTALRSVRLRFYASPFGFPVRALPPCDYCGDFIVSYVPAGAVFVLDGQAQRATVTVGGVTTDATHLLYGTGGQPFQWPLLSCGTTYYMTCDIPWWDQATEPEKAIEPFSFWVAVAGRD